jgi:hypothetical protein
MVMTTSPLLTPDETAALLRRHPRTLRRWAHLGYGVQPIPVGRKLMYRRQDIDAYLDNLAETAGNGHWQGPKQQSDVAEPRGVQPAPAVDAAVAA